MVPTDEREREVARMRDNEGMNAMRLSAEMGQPPMGDKPAGDVAVRESPKGEAQQQTPDEGETQQEPAKEAEPVIVEDVQKEFGERGRLLLQDVSSGKLALSEESFGWLRTLYAPALNQAKCPCGSGKNYSDCCKMLWRMIESEHRAMKRLSRDPGDEVAKKALEENERLRKSQEEMGEVRWMVRLGLSKDGAGLVIDPIHDGEKKLEPAQLVDILSTALDMVKETEVVRKVASLVMRNLPGLVKQLVAANDPSNNQKPRTAF